MATRFGIGALAVAALIAAVPASAQLSAQLGAKPAVGTVIGVTSAIDAAGATLADNDPGVVEEVATDGGELPAEPGTGSMENPGVPYATVESFAAPTGSPGYTGPGGGGGGGGFGGGALGGGGGLGLLVAGGAAAFVVGTSQEDDSAPASPS